MINYFKIVAQNLFNKRQVVEQPVITIPALKNPYTLVWYRAGWSKAKTQKNNLKYWEWEILHNGFKCP